MEEKFFEKQSGRPEMNKEYAKFLVYGKIIVVGLVMILLFSNLIVFTPPGENSGLGMADSQTNYNNPPDVRSARSGDTNLNVTVIGSFSPAYIGDQGKEFYFVITESYNGEHLDYNTPFSTPEGDHNNSLWNVTLQSMEFYRNDQPMSPVVWDDTRNQPDNNGNQGWLLAWSQSIYNDSGANQMFRFDVKSSGLELGQYELRLTFEYRILRNYTDATGVYNFTSVAGSFLISETEVILFEVRSCMSSNLMVDAVAENNQVQNSGRFFAGAKNQKMRITFDKAYPGASLDNVNITMIPPTIAELYGSGSVPPQNTVSINSMTGNTAFYWRVNIHNDVTAGIYQGTPNNGYVQYEYTRSDNQIHIQEADKYLVDFIIDFTPLLNPPETNGMTNVIASEHQLDSSTAETTIEVEIRNNGNVNLFNLELGLNLFNSFIQAPFYYDAGSSDFKTELIVSDNTIDELLMGESAMARFNLSLFKGLPRGKYFIPLVYTAWYYNNGTLGDTTGFVRTDEMDFTLIRGAQQYSMLDSRAHIAIEILNPQPHITVTPINNNTYMAGDQDQMIIFAVNNYELYPFQNVTVTIQGQNTPFEHKSLNDTLLEIATGKFYTLPGGAPGLPYTATFSVLVNILPDANGFYSIPVKVTGWDVYNEYFEIDTEFEISVTPQLPVIKLVHSTNSKVIPGENFTVTVTLKNVGYSTAHDLEVLFIGSTGYTNTFTPTGTGLAQVGNLSSDAQVILSFNATAASDLEMNTDYQVSLNFQFKDALTNNYGFNTNPSIFFMIRTPYEPLPPSSEVFLITSVESPTIEPDKSVKLTVSILNVGNFEIAKSDVKLVSNSNLFTITRVNSDGTGEGNLGSFEVGKQKTIQYNVKVSKSVEYGQEYEFQMFIQYEDANGDVKEYDTTDGLPITLRVQDEPTEDDPANWELITVGVLILIAVIFFTLVLFLIVKKYGIGGMRGEEPSEGVSKREKEIPPEEPEPTDEEEELEPEEDEKEEEELESGEEAELEKEPEPKPEPEKTEKPSEPEELPERGTPMAATPAPATPKPTTPRPAVTPIIKSAPAKESDDTTS
jgi:hypothetical protein